jgi:soluble lytic murein transglycosylase-like protein
MIAYSWVYKKISKSHGNSESSVFLANTIISTSEQLLNNNYKLGTCIIGVESSFKIGVKGDDGVSTGLSQIKEGAAKDACRYLGLNKCNTTHIRYLISKPRYNILLGLGYLSLLIHRYNDINKAIEAYNIGIKNIDAGGTNIPYLNKVKACVREK